MKKLFALFLALIMALSLVACGGDTATEETTDDTAAEETTGDTATSDIEIAVVLKTLSSEYWGYVKAGCDAAAADLGVKVTVVGPGAESEIEQQVAMIEQQIGAGCDAIHRRSLMTPGDCFRCYGQLYRRDPRPVCRNQRWHRGADLFRRHLQRGRRQAGWSVGR